MRKDTSSRSFVLGLGEPEVSKKNYLCWKEVNQWVENPVYVSLNDYDHLQTGEKWEQLPKVPFIHITDEETMRYYSWVGAFLGVKNPSFPYVLVRTGGDQAISLRKPAHSPVDLSKIAVKFGGGGHRSASGFSF